ncbi:hypothetical protein F2264_21470 [Salmonella enterica]|nr:hypothetical protein [Salmonella enterica]EAO3601644.1 hypothetical protein [Salmonella enterica]ECC2205759.1 hypothetical protein [Salmonella enterica]ECU5200737.1 hypothetical protein [Salmonella enterica]
MQGTADLWYRQTYKLPPNHPLYLDTTLEERVTEFWAWQYAQDPKLMDVVEDESFDLEEIQRQWAEENGEDPDIYMPPEPVPNPDEIDDWEDVNGN